MARNPNKQKPEAEKTTNENETSNFPAYVEVPDAPETVADSGVSGDQVVGAEDTFGFAGVEYPAKPAENVLANIARSSLEAVKVLGESGAFDGSPVPADRHPVPEPSEPAPGNDGNDADTIALLMQEIAALRKELYRYKISEASAPVGAQNPKAITVPIEDDDYYTIEKAKMDHLVYSLIWAPNVGQYHGRTGILRLAGLFGKTGTYEDCRSFLALKREAVMNKSKKGV